tara:strand:- start:92771 stop:93346 length:576 start_codon:yes stop_codon:yes gene_type:complete
MMNQLGGYIATAKYDGWRTIVDWTGSQVGFFSRRGMSKGGPTEIPVSEKIAEDTKTFLIDNKIPADTRLDAEWLGRRHDGKEQLFIFGVQFYNGSWVGSDPERIRWEIVKGLSYNSDLVQLAENSESSYDEFFQKLKNDDLKRNEDSWILEGIVLKHESSSLLGNIMESKKNGMWFKTKWRDGATGKVETF